MSSPELRTEQGESQGELAAKIDSDTLQVSRYEGGKVAPSLEAVIRIAYVVDVTVDYLVIPAHHDGRCTRLRTL